MRCSAGQCPQGSLTEVQHLHSCQQHLGQQQRQHLAHRHPEERSSIHHTEMDFVVSITSSWRAAVEGRTPQLQQLLPEVLPVLFSFGSQAYTGKFFHPLQGCCSSTSLSCKFTSNSKAGTSLKLHEFLALGFHRSQATKYAS